MSADRSELRVEASAPFIKQCPQYSLPVNVDEGGLVGLSYIEIYEMRWERQRMNKPVPHI